MKFFKLLFLFTLFAFTINMTDSRLRKSCPVPKIQEEKLNSESSNYHWYILWSCVFMLGARQRNRRRL